MKKLFSIPMVLILAGIILSSCSTVSITKRRYNKGYFVEHSSNRHTAPKNREDQKLARQQKPEKQSAPIKAIESLATTNVPAASEKKNPATSLTASAPKKTVHSSKASLRQDVVNLAMRSPVKALKQASQIIKSGDASGEALSLLWIVIVVILIVYLLGLLFDGFGLGSAIHILAVIALVLLILWLLRIL